MTSNRKKKVWMGAAVAAVTFASPSMAQQVEECPKPTLGDCSSEAYQGSACAAKHQAICDKLFTLAFQDAYDKRPERPEVVETDVLTPSPQQKLAKVLAEQRAEVFAGGHASTFRGFLNVRELVPRDGFTKEMLEEQKADKDLFGKNGGLRSAVEKLERFGANGSQIEACEEYVLELHPEFTRFEEDLRRTGWKYDQIFEQRRRIKPKLNQQLLDAAGRVHAELVFSNPIEVVAHAIPGLSGVKRQVHAKNGYFDAYRRLQKGGFTLPPMLHRAFEDAADETAYENGWSFQEKASAALRGISSARLDGLHDRQRALADLVGEWEVLRASHSPALPLSPELLALEDALRAAFEEGAKEGCSNRKDITACDWSPKQFVTEMEAQSLAERTALFDGCTAILPVQGFAAIPAAHKSGPRAFAAFIEAEQKAQATKASSLPGGNGIYGLSRGDADSFGKSGLIELAYDYGGRYRLTIPNSGKCNAELDAGAHFKAGVDVFNAQKDSDNNLIDVSARYLSTPSKVTFTHHFKVQGNDVYQPINHRLQGATPFTLQLAPSRTHKLKGTKRFFLMSIPVAVTAGVTAKVGLGLKAELDARAQCPATKGTAQLAKVAGEVRPSVRANAHASAAMDWVAAKAGVRGDVLVINANMPFTVDAALVGRGQSNGQAAVSLDLDTSLRSDVRTLDGSLTAFLNTPVGNAEQRLFSWNGLRDRRTLFQKSASFELAQLDALP